MDIAERFVARSRHYLSYEYPAKIQHCLDALPADAVWRRANERSNSVGNLLLHLSGNVRQWMVCGVGGAPDHRHRDAEFAATEGADAKTLMSGLRQTLRETDVVLSGLNTEMLGESRTIQGRTVTVLDAVYHVVEHFSTHTGQIILLTKLAAVGSIAFYEDAGGLAVPIWERPHRHTDHSL
ncbi:MAG: DinB family protein [bacterium]